MDYAEESGSLLSILDDFGIRVSSIERWESVIRGTPDDVELSRNNSSQLYTVISTLNAMDGIGQTRTDDLVDRSTELGDRRHLVVADRINVRTMTTYRNRKIDYVDLAGNALIRFGDVYVDVRGRNLAARKTTNESRHAPTNLFSARRAQVTFALIVWPELLTLPIRYTSEAAGVSIGIAFQTIQLLRHRGYLLDEMNPYIVRKSELIDRWTDAFATGLRNKLAIAAYRGEHLDVLSGGSEAQWFISGESAVRSLVRPTTLTIYVNGLDSALIAANRWRRDGQPNIDVRQKFWKDPRQILHEDRGLEFQDLEHEAPALLVYADLMASGDGRQREAAQSFRNSNHELGEG
jgi:hypothetical protein